MIDKVSLAVAAVLAVALPSAAEPFHHPFGEWREYNRDWLAACPDVIDEDAADYYGFSCFASTGSAEPNSAGLPAYKMSVLLNRLNGELDVSFSIQADGLEADTSRPLIVSFTGQAPLTYDFLADLETRYNTINQFYVADAAKREALLELMRERNAVTLTVPVNDGDDPTRKVTLSLRGVTASIDFMRSYARRLAQY
jgi:hypothetical protein